MAKMIVNYLLRGVVEVDIPDNQLGENFGETQAAMSVDMEQAIHEELLKVPEERLIRNLSRSEFNQIDGDAIGIEEALEIEDDTVICEWLPPKKDEWM